MRDEKHIEEEFSQADSTLDAAGCTGAQKAKQGLIKNFTGYSSKYEIPINPDLILDTENESIFESVEKCKKVL